MQPQCAHRALYYACKFMPEGFGGHSSIFIYTVHNVFVFHIRKYSGCVYKSLNPRVGALQEPLESQRPTLEHTVSVFHCGVCLKTKLPHHIGLIVNQQRHT